MRALDPDVIAQIESNFVRPAFFFEGEFTSSPIRLWTGLGDISWDSKTWYGNGWLQGFGGIGETADIKATNLEITLAGVPSNVIELALNEVSQNKAGRLWIAFLGDADYIVPDPFLIFEGKLDTAEIDDGSKSASVTFTYETELIDLEKAEEQRYTDAYQRSIYPDDTGLRYITAMADWDGFFGVPEKKNKQRTKPRTEVNRRRR